MKLSASYTVRSSARTAIRRSAHSEMEPSMICAAASLAVSHGPDRCLQLWHPTWRARLAAD
jgi:hypothetical protein